MIRSKAILNISRRTSFQSKRKGWVYSTYFIPVFLLTHMVYSFLPLEGVRIFGFPPHITVCNFKLHSCESCIPRRNKEHLSNVHFIYVVLPLLPSLLYAIFTIIGGVVSYHCKSCIPTETFGCLSIAAYFQK